MGAIRTPKKWNENKFRCLYYYVLQYPEWRKEYNRAVSARTISYGRNGDGGGGGDPTAKQAIRKAELKKKMEIIEDAVRQCCPGIESYMLQAITEPLTWDIVEARGIPCCRKVFFKKRHEVLSLIYYQIFGESIEK